MHGTTRNTCYGTAGFPEARCCWFIHEFAVTKSLLDLVLQYAEQAGAGRVGKINLVIGEMTGVVSDSVKFYMDFMSKDTVVEGAALDYW